MSGFEWIVDPERAFSTGFDAWTTALKQAIFRLAQYFAPQIESWMKAEALWTDRTGNARQSLWADAKSLVTSVAIEMGYGVDYGKYLEYANGGNYAIIAPALDHWTPIIMKAVQDLLR